MKPKLVVNPLSLCGWDLQVEHFTVTAIRDGWEVFVGHPRREGVFYKWEFERFDELVEALAKKDISGGQWMWSRLLC